MWSSPPCGYCTTSCCKTQQLWEQLRSLVSLSPPCGTPSPPTNHQDCRWPQLTVSEGQLLPPGSQDAHPPLQTTHECGQNGKSSSVRVVNVTATSSICSTKGQKCDESTSWGQQEADGCHGLLGQQRQCWSRRSLWFTWLFCVLSPHLLQPWVTPHPPPPPPTDYFKLHFCLFKEHAALTSPQGIYTNEHNCPNSPRKRNVLLTIGLR